MKKTYNSTFLLLFTSVILIGFNSCKNSNDTKLVYIESETIKQSVKEKEQGITWTQEIEKDRLTQKIKRNGIEASPEVPFNKDLYKITKNIQNPVYPSYYDFGSLDITNLKPEIKEKLNAFCKAFSSEAHKNASSYFHKKYLFNYIFFENDIDTCWQKNFNVKLPENSEYFNKWIFGEPFYGDDIIQIPVRFYADCGTIDVMVFLSSGGNNEFYQITIDRWKKV